MEQQKSYSRKRTFYNQDPEYTRPLLEIPPEIRDRMFSRLRFLYGERPAHTWMPELERILKVHYAHKPPEMIEKEKHYDPKERFSEQHIILITYGDIVRGEGETPLAILRDFINTHHRGAINTLHILPFFPYSSDRGFAVVDFKHVDPKLGTWEDIRETKRRYDLMFDAVLNHCSSRSEMFREFLNGNPRYQNFFIAYDSPNELTPDQRSKIFRPRTSDILTRFDTLSGPKYVWTTFSEDQIDLNFRNPEVLIQIVESVLFYVRRGADILRLDAVTYIWAEPGTECVRLPQTHEIVKLLRDVVDTVASGVALITETNVPHEDNISYFGDGYDEAHMVYNFALPPLALHTFYRQDAAAISRWAENLRAPSDMTTFFNILDTHDGIGLMGVKGILPQEDIAFIIQKAQERGAYISYKMTEDRTEEPYEINTTWWSAINGDNSNEDIALQVKRYIASRSLALVLQGVPGVYVHGALGTPNNHQLVKATGLKRDVNRGVIDGAAIADDLKNASSRLSLLRQHSPKLNLPRTRQRAFHPRGDQRVLMISPDVFVVFRTSPEGDDHVLTVTNVTSRTARIEIPLAETAVKEKRWYDLISEKEWVAEGEHLPVTLQPYDVVWLKPDSEMEKNHDTRP